MVNCSKEEEKCPEICTCTNLMTLKCENRNLSRIPDIPQGVKYLIFNFNTIQYIDENVFSNSLNISQIDLQHNNLKSIPDNIFKGLELLEYVDLSYNELNTVPEELFYYNSQLKLIAIRNNKLTSFNFNILRNNIMINYVHLQYNNLSKLEGSRSIVSLRSLRLRGNMLKSFPENFLNLLPNLNDLGLGGNKINNISDILNNIKKEHLKIIFLDMPQNIITEVTSTTLMGLNYLRDLILSHNNIFRISPCAFQMLRAIRDINLSNNFLYYIPDGVFSSLLSLERLIINNNCLTTLSRNVFSELYRLRQLYIRNNPLSYIASDTFSSLKSLLILDLSNIQNVPLKPVHIPYLINLRSLIMTNCGLAFKNVLLYDAISKMSSLYTIVLDKNPICYEYSARMLSTVFFMRNTKHRLIRYDNRKLNMSDEYVHPKTCSMKKKFTTYDNYSCSSFLCPSTCECGSSFYNTSSPNSNENNFKYAIDDIPMKEQLVNYTIMRCSNWPAIYLPKNISTNTIVVYTVHGNVKHINEIYSQNMSKLHYLDLSRNKIRFLPIKLFYSLKNLKTLNISYNYIKDFHSLQFQNLHSLINFIADHNFITSVNTILFNLPRLEIVNLSHNELICINLYQIRKLKEIFLNNNIISNIVNNASYLVTQQHACKIPQNNIQNFFCQDFKEFFLLKTLKLNNNNISTIRQKLFQDFSNLKELDLSHNSIDEFPCGFLNSSKSLKKLRIGNNKVKIFSKCHILGLTTLSEISLNNNIFENIDNEFFSYLRHLNHIDLSSSKLEAFPIGITNYCRNLRELYISNNLFIMKFEYLKSLTKFEKLAVENTSLVLRPIDKFQDLGKFAELHLSHNKIKNIWEVTFENLTSLLYLNISHNSVSYLHKYSFHHLRNLSIIDLSHNQIRNLDNSIFESNTELLTLDISYNLLYFISPGVLSHTRKLKYLNLSSNNIQRLTKNTFLNNEHILNLDLSNNKLTVIDFNIFTPFTLIHDVAERIIPWAAEKIDSINLKNNSLKIINNFLDQRYSRQIKILILSDNPQLQHKANFYKEVNKVRKLNIENTGINKKSLTALDELFKLTSLKNVYMNRNPICNPPVLGCIQILFSVESMFRYAISCSA